MGDVGRVRWVEGSPGKSPAVHRPGRQDRRRLSLL
jgi:hypothetical protein